MPLAFVFYCHAFKGMAIKALKFLALAKPTKNK
jgi:hypothetical protein